MTGDPILRVNLNAGYGARQILSGLEFDLMPGDALGLVGTSGAGKSTLVLALLGLLRWRGGRASGTAEFQGQNLLNLSEKELRRLRGSEIAMIPQSPLSALNPAVSLATHFREAWLAHQQPAPAAMKARVDELMQEVSLPCSTEFLRRRPGQISVGQAQRVLIALALLHRPALLIADEPTSALDPVTQTQIVALLQRLARTQCVTMLYISHDLVSVLQLCSRVAVLDAGRIIETLPTHLLHQARQSTTISLLAALPVPLEVMMQYLGQQHAAEPSRSSDRCLTAS